MSALYRPCDACSQANIAPDDLHSKCFSCLGPVHAAMALTAQVSCAFCPLLSPEEKRRRVDFFQGPALAPPPVDDVPSELQTLELFAPGFQSGDSDLAELTDEETASMTEALNEALEPALDVLSGNAPPGHEYSAGPSLTAIRALLLELPAIVQAAASNNGLEVPVPAPPRANLFSGRFGASQARCSDPVFPLFPSAMEFWTASYPEPSRLKAPVSAFVPITKAQGFTDNGFPAVPPLEPDLVSLLGAKAKMVGHRIVPVSRYDQADARFTDRAHQCAAQSGAASSNIALLASSVTHLVENTDIPEETKDLICKTTDTILNLSAVNLICASRIAVWQIMVQRNMWLCSLTSAPEQLQKNMLDGPISPDALFGAQFRSAIESAQKTAELSATVRDLVQPPANRRYVAKSRSYDDRRAQRSRQRRQNGPEPYRRQPPPPATAAVAASRPASSFQQRRRNRPPATGWQAPNQEQTPRRPTQ
uniref:Uncharacterized protein n=1 Tax=Iconisemion striatum TaxID=60296 RepID=A0A1A7WP31_9TELE